MIATEQRPLHSERRDAKLERQRARRQDRDAKRSRTHADAFGQLAALLDDAGWHPEPAAAPGHTSLALAEPDVAPAQSTAAEPPTSEQPDRPAEPQGRGRFQSARQEAADRARDTATAMIAAAVDRAGARRAGENTVVRHALQTLAAADARWSDVTHRIDAAMANGNAKELLRHAKRAVWEVARDAANTARSDAYLLAAGEVCAALAVIERLPVATVRSGERTRSKREPSPGRG